MTVGGRVPDGLLSFQGTLAVLALHLARQIHFHAPLVAGPQSAERCSWHSPLYRFLSSSWWHPHSCEFLVLKGQRREAGSFLWARKYLWLHLRKRAISGSLHFLSKVRGRGVGKCYPHWVWAMPPLSVLQCLPDSSWREYFPKSLKRDYRYDNN